MTSTGNPPPDFPRDLDGNRAEYERLLREDAKAAIIKFPKDGEPPQEKPRPDT